VAVLWLLPTSLGFVDDFQDQLITLAGPGALSFPGGSGAEDYAPLQAASTVRTDLHLWATGHVFTSLLPVQMVLWTQEERSLAAEQHRPPLPPLDGQTIQQYCTAQTCAPEGAEPFSCSLLHLNSISDDRIRTIYLAGNVTRTVRENYTIADDGAYTLVLSSCMEGAHVAVLGEVEWKSVDGGSLPVGILGIMPFYGSLSGIYFILALIWTYRIRKFWGCTITLQFTLFLVILANMLYTALAFAYYLHLDLDTRATSRQVFGGVYAGFYQVNDVFAIAVAVYRFMLISLLEALLSALSDGLYILRDRVRPTTQLFIVIIIASQLAVLISQKELWGVAPWLSSLVQLLVIVVWLVWLGFSSYFTWRSLYDEEPDVHIRWSVPLKQRVYRTVCRAIFLYPCLNAIMYSVFLIFKDSWRWLWLKLVVFDVWMCLVLLPASWHWLPHSRYAQYAPLMEEMPAAAPVMEMASVALERSTTNDPSTTAKTATHGVPNNSEEFDEEDEESQQMIV